MYAIHATRKLLTRVGAPVVDMVPAPSTTLGNWYATAIFVRPQLGLFVSETTLLPVLVPLAPARTLAGRIPEFLRGVLHAVGVDVAEADAEAVATTDARWTTTANRSVVGVMVDQARHATYGFDQSVDLVSAAAELAHMPVRPLFDRHTFPDREVVAFFDSRR